MAERITAVCKPCKKVLYQGQLSLTDPHISHGLCEACSTKMLWQEGISQEELTEFIETHKEVNIEA
ncbi:hypothetical protein KAR91_05675 [Candidatus Pacearchaeota archaeon]|nr:hypothetical protein [Candidatus Pacearchaeota archaeon]